MPYNPSSGGLIHMAHADQEFGVADANAAGTHIRVGTVAELTEKGMMVVKGRHCPILVLHHDGAFYALDNRCPHLGFPLHRGSVEDGILTCHWHHARFDLESGGTFDLWADDARVCPAELRGDEVWVAADCGYRFKTSYWRTRLHDGMAHNLGLVTGKAVLALLDHGVAANDVVEEAVLFGARNRDGWSSGMTILTALANLLPHLDENDRYLALLQGIRRVAGDAAGEPSRRNREPLGNDEVDAATLQRWLRRWTLVRHRNGGERTLLTAIASDLAPPALCDLLLTAATDRYYAGGGHTLDFINKACECLDLIGWDRADVILPTVIADLVSARGEEESNSWRHPIDLVPLLEGSFGSLAERWRRGRAANGDWSGHAGLAQQLLGDDPHAIVAAIDTAIAAGASADDLGRTLAYAAALRVARFGTANEHSDWETAHHVFTYCNAVHQGLKRIDGRADRDEPTQALRGVYHGAMAIYLERFLNVPPARLPGTCPGEFDALPQAADDLCAALLDAMDRHRQIDGCARIVARYLALGHEPAHLIAVLGHALLREDAGFHCFQMYEAGVRQFGEWNGAPEGHYILVAMTRYLAAHAPTERSQFQTADIAHRLHRRVDLYEDEEAAAADI